MNTAPNITVNLTGAQLFVTQEELASQLGMTIRQVRSMARKGELPKPVAFTPKQDWRWRSLDILLHKAPISSLKVAVANDAGPALDPATGRMSGDWAIEQAKQRRAAPPANAG